MSSHNASLTLEQGLKIQAHQLKRWASILKPEAMQIVEVEASIRNECLKKNSTADGYDVWRGNAIDEFIFNEVIPVMMEGKG